MLLDSGIRGANPAAATTAGIFAVFRIGDLRPCLEFTGAPPYHNFPTEHRNRDCVKRVVVDKLRSLDSDRWRCSVRARLTHGPGP
jgi:hypothetical protein